MANKKLKLLYLAQFLHAETDEAHPKTVADMIAYLDKCGISAERKSIYDDLELLRTFGMDIQTNKSKSYGYFLGERPFQLAELKLLTDVVQASPFLSGKKSTALIGKLTALTSRHGATQLQRQVYVMNRLRTSNESLYYAVDGIHTAINDNRKVSFRYSDWTVEGTTRPRRGGKSYVVDPVALCVDRYYYLVAYDGALGQYRHYRVDRISQLQLLEAPRSPLPEHFDLGAYTRTIFDMYNGQTATVSLLVDETLLNVMVDRFATDAHMYKEDGRVHLTAQVELGPTFYGWLFQFGKQARLLNPESAVEGFRQWASETLGQYE